MLYSVLKYELGCEGPLWPIIAPYSNFVNILSIALLMLIAYFLGSINTAILVSKMMYKDDIRRYGSGNAGFTNVMRTYGMKAAGITMAGDILKTILAIVIGWVIRGYFGAYLAALACFFGHIFPVFHQFKGGKGVLCTAASVLCLDWRIFLICMSMFVGIVLVTRYISLGSTIAAMLLPLFTNRFYAKSLEDLWIANIVTIIIAVVIVIKHIPNLKRIMKGEESKFSFKKSKKA